MYPLFFGIEHIRCRAHLGSRWELLSAHMLLFETRYST